MKRAFLVLGPESSGTRLVTRLLMAAGCQGSADHYQPWDDLTVPLPNGDLVWRRSVPHAIQGLNLPGLLARFRYMDQVAVHAIVTVRDWHPLALSQVKDHHALSYDHACQQIALAYTQIFSQLHLTMTPFVMAVYESLILHPVEAQASLLTLCGLPVPDPVSITDEDAKYFLQQVNPA